MITLKFYKEDTSINRRWYVDLPTYSGSKEDCLMIAGADILLDIISGGGDSISIQCSEKPEFEENQKHLVLTKVDDFGHYYVSQYYFNIWLCEVTKFVFDGKYPDKICCNY